MIISITKAANSFLILVKPAPYINVINGGLNKLLATLVTSPLSSVSFPITPTIKPVTSAALFLMVCLFWYVIHYVTQKTNALIGGDISEISIVFSYACYIVLYIRVLAMKKQGEIKSLFKGVLCPVFGILGAGIIFVGGFISNPVYVFFFMLFCFLITFAGYLQYGRLGAKGEK